MMGVDHDFNRVKPGHINMGRALRSLSMKTDQSRQLTLSIPAVYVKDTYGVETSTVQMPAIEIPGLNGLVSPITTKDFSLAKEGRYIAGAARIYMPSMDQIFKKLNTNTDSFYPNYPWMSQTRPVTDTNTVMKDYFRSIDGLMNAVLYDSEAIIFNSQPAIYAEGTTNWDSSTDYSSYFEIKIKNIRFYRSLPWSIHSVKERKDDYVILNCVRTDGDSMHRQEVYGEQVPEL
jgi:hypothetical protein